MSAGYIKVRFHKAGDRTQATAGLVLEADRYYNMTIPDISRLFPMSEAGKMERFENSKIYPTWDKAFLHDFAE